ncbi:Tox-REase-5 domain-containing protein [Comamonas sp. JC664]|uniref:Tox-REase-5 domain-containing protein n=1 Tax=Comamonas sp. JC664 TaxID=2801917 RepID=UPI00191E9010|nr:hypothetical protein [Comamonas sp. JC664]GHG96511.1 hypothetical protein GCM10012319_61040 [Comamonas sp. KCTC 72670]
MEALEGWPGSEGSLTPMLAARLLEALGQEDVTLGQFPARMAVGYMLREVLTAGAVSRAELDLRAERFAHLAVLRPDGYLAWVRSGKTQQRVSAVEWKDGTFRAGQFALGVFYSGRGGVFRELNGRLQESGHGAFADVHDDADYVSRTLDGAEEAFVGLALAVGQFFSTSPVENMAALQRMPAAVAALISSSPEYLQRFRYMTRGEQVQAVSRLATGLLTTWGTASSVSRTLHGALVGVEGSVPVLSLSAEGVLVLERVSVPARQVVAVLSGGPGAAIILQRANAAAQGAGAPEGPGHWGPAKESMSPRARRYQEQVSGRPADEAYWVRNVKFDGFESGVLLEAKGPGYANKFLDNLKPKIWFEGSGARALVEQAQRQLAVTPRGVPLRWCIAEEKTAEAIRLLFQKERVIGIEVIYVPPL